METQLYVMDALDIARGKVEENRMNLFVSMIDEKIKAYRLQAVVERKILRQAVE